MWITGSVALLSRTWRGGNVSGHLAGAFLDVFTAEPLPPDSPFWDLPNVIVSPHSAAASDGLAERVAAVFCENLGRWRRGEPLRNLVAAAPRP